MAGKGRPPKGGGDDTNGGTGAAKSYPFAKSGGYTYGKNAPELQAITMFTVTGYGPVTRDGVIAQWGKLGVPFTQKVNLLSTAEKALKHLRDRDLIVCDALAQSEEKDGVERTYMVKKAMLGAIFGNDPGDVVPAITTMQMKSNPQTQEWLEYLESLAGKGKKKVERKRMVTIRYTLKATQEFVGTKPVRDQVQMVRLSGMNEAVDQGPVSFLPRDQRGRIIIPGGYVMRSVRDQAPNVLHNRNVERMLVCRDAICRTHDVDPSYINGEPRPNTPDGTCIKTYPIPRANAMDRNEPCSISRAEAAPAGFYVDGELDVHEDIGVEFILAILSRGIYLGAKRSLGQGLAQLTSFEVLGDSRDPKTFLKRRTEQDEEVERCRQALMGVINVDAPSLVANENEMPPAQKFVFQQPVGAGSIDDVFSQAKDAESIHPS